MVAAAAVVLMLVRMVMLMLMLMLMVSVLLVLVLALALLLLLLLLVLLLLLPFLPIPRAGAGAARHEQPGDPTAVDGDCGERAFLLGQPPAHQRGSHRRIFRLHGRFGGCGEEVHFVRRAAATLWALALDWGGHWSGRWGWYGLD